ncbi:MAG: enoyl-CoA hydratase/isomerase family protein [Planctomycetes bacterium]|nr:enoyl-CoA hydratase/isomerase family protein [Planctomycetota bacterium]
MIDLTGFPAPENAPPPRACVRLERPEPGVVVLVLDPPHRKLAVFDLPLLRDLDLALDEVEREPALAGLVITGRTPTSFAAGADLDGIASLTDPALVARLVHAGQVLFERVARLSHDRHVRTVAAVGGPVPGGAFELSLACNLILFADDKSSRIGLPETQLGILPGWGGTNRLPRRVGVPVALDAILTGRLYAPRDAYKLGLVDRLAFPEDLRRIALELASGRMKLEKRTRGLQGILIDRDPLATAVIASQARKQVLEKTRGKYPAPLLALEIAARAPHTSLEKGLEAERNAVAQLAVGPVCKNLIAIFRLSEEAKKLKELPNGGSAKAPARAGVLGAGVMGRGIASSLAEKGIATRLFDVAPAALDVALIEHRGEIVEKRKKRRLEPSAANDAIDKLDATRALVGFRRCEIVIEAVAEKLAVKREVFGALARELADDAILATNTSSLSVDAIAEGIPHPERVVGLHFFNPVKKMPLVEIVRGAKTSPETVARCAALCLQLGKTPVVTRDVAGFLVNRLLGPYLDEALRLFAGGVDPKVLDDALLDFGMPMGPLELCDEVGFDIATHAAQSLHAAYGERMTPNAVLEGPVRDGRLGKKTGKGFYVHAPAEKGAKRPKKELADDLARLVPGGAPRSPLTAPELVAERCVLAMLNEAARALHEEVVAGPRELDLATVFGMGFAPFKGGLLRWADSVGTQEIVARLERHRAMSDVQARGTAGDQRFAPCERLVWMARNLRSFHG